MWQKEIQHLYHRAGFGPKPEFVMANAGKSRQWHVQRLFDQAAKAKSLKILKDPTNGGQKTVGKGKLALKILKSRKDLKKLNLAWIERMADTDAQLAEKMTFFWHDHFATFTPLAFLMQVQNNTLRKHALGSFRDMLHAIAKDPAMLIFLNNQQNRKNQPNENFAREVMELFTLGEGHYTEQDIKEAARAFTGWQVNFKGEFEFNEKQHDFGNKTVFGKTGNFNGEDILEMLLENKQTARTITRKIYKWFVSVRIPEERLETLATQFYNSGYDIGALMAVIFTADWFYEDANMGSLVKSPVELLVQFLRMLNAEYKRDELFVKVQKGLGQILFFPPNVAGWPHNREWIDSSSLLLRMRLPLVIFGLDDLDIEIKPEYEDMGQDASTQKIPRFLEAKVNWKPLMQALKGKDEKELADIIPNLLIQCPQRNVNRRKLLDFTDDSSRENFIKSLVIRTIALPEFQLK